MQQAPEFPAADKRLASLLQQLQPASGPCPFVVDDDASQGAALSHWSGGRDATYVFVSRKRAAELPRPDLAVTIRYAPFVAGTTIIYDLSDEMLQGKARPFVCNLGPTLQRVYAVLPFQIEQTSLHLAGIGRERRLRIRFLDARREQVQAAFPFELRLTGASGNLLWTANRATDRAGVFDCLLESLGNSPLADCRTLLVRSLLTGQAESLALQPGDGAS